MVILIPIDQVGRVIGVRGVEPGLLVELAQNQRRVVIELGSLRKVAQQDGQPLPHRHPASRHRRAIKGPPRLPVVDLALGDLDAGGQRNMRPGSFHGVIPQNTQIVLRQSPAVTSLSTLKLMSSMSMTVRFIGPRPFQGGPA